MKEKIPRPPYYSINIKKLEITSLNPFRTNSYVAYKKIPYYRGRLGRLIRIENDEPTTTREEAEWWLQDVAKRNPANAVGLDAIYIDENSIEPLDINEEEVKQLRLAYKRNKTN